MSYIGRQNLGGAYRQLDDISSGFDGSDTTHTMQVNSQNVTVGDVNQIILSLGGVIQKPGTDFTVSGSVLTFTTAPAANTSFFAILLGSDNGGTVTPTDGSVTPGKTTFFNTNPGNAADLGMLHIKSGDSSASVSVHADELVLEGSANAGLSVLSGTSNTGSIFFGDSGDNDIGYIQYEHGSTNSLYFGTNAGTRMIIDSTGAVTMPQQPAVSVRKTGTQSNMSNNDTITFDTEDRDQNADFASNTFTAPVSGNYLICLNVAVTGPDGVVTYNRVKVITSNRNYSFGITAKQHYDVSQGDPDYDNFSGSLVTYMDANDTAYIVWSQVGGSDKADAFDSTFASFTLIC